jgi:hypothetical protein
MVKSPITASDTSLRSARKTTVSREQFAATSLRHNTPVLAGEDVVPLLVPLQMALGVNGLRRGSTVLLDGGEGFGATSLALALLAKATTDGMWCSVVGPPDLGMVAAVELGVDLERLVVVTAPRSRTATAIGALVEGCDVVMLRLPLAITRAEMIRLGARARQRRVLLVLLADPRSRAVAWPEAPDVTVLVRSSTFYGIENGSGRIAGRRVDVETIQRRSAGAPTVAALWLPAANGELRLVSQDDLDRGRSVGRTATPTLGVAQPRRAVSQ